MLLCKVGLAGKSAASLQRRAEAVWVRVAHGSVMILFVTTRYKSGYLVSVSCVQSFSLDIGKIAITGICPNNEKIIILNTEKRQIEGYSGFIYYLLVKMKYYTQEAYGIIKLINYSNDQHYIWVP